LKNWHVDDLTQEFADHAWSELESEKLDQQFRLQLSSGALPDVDQALQFTKPMKPIELDGIQVHYGLPVEFDRGAFAEQLLTRLIVGPARALRDHLSGIRYLGPIRQAPPPDHAPPQQPDSSRWASGLGAWDALAMPEGDGLAKQVSNWLGPDHLDTGYRLKVWDVGQVSQPGNQTVSPAEAEGNAPGSKELPESASQQSCGHVVYLHDIDRQVDLSLRSVGVGLSQVIPVLTLALMDGVSMCIMEQPELHLHPALQAELGDVFIESAIRGHKTFLLETHSEHLILRLLRRIRETSEGKCPAPVALRPEDICVLYAQPAKDGNKLIELRVDPTGEFVDRWPDGFFEERAKELFG